MTAACFGDAIHAQVVLLPRRFKSDIKVAGPFGYACLKKAHSCCWASATSSLLYKLHVIEPFLFASTSSKLKSHGTTSFQ